MTIQNAVEKFMYSHGPASRIALYMGTADYRALKKSWPEAAKAFKKQHPIYNDQFDYAACCDHIWKAVSR